jgi:uncharacterized membrane protein YeaQ/YmgE (transglycosylase-associated protein family)
MIALGILVTAFVTGALARFALPGPDPMPAWLTIVIGLAGTFIGYSVVFAVQGRHSKDVSWGGIASFFAAVILVVLYRRFVQKRAVWGKDAYRFPKRGFGVEHARERLRKVGIDPDQIGASGTPFGNPQPGVAVPRPPAAPAHDHPDHPGQPTENPAHYLGLLEELHDSGVLDDAEYDGARLRLLEQLR